MLVLKGLVGLHRTVQLQILNFSITGWGIGLDHCDIEWFALEMNRDHSVIGKDSDAGRESSTPTITAIQVHAPTSNAEEAEDLQDLLELTSKKDVFCFCFYFL